MFAAMKPSDQGAFSLIAFHYGKILLEFFQFDFYTKKSTERTVTLNVLKELVRRLKPIGAVD